ncbi:MAG: TadE family type IV pilus minor pilin [Nocardioides sp.]
MTAELVMGLPLLLAITVGLVWLLAVGAAQVRAVDAAREAARAMARGDDPARAIAVGERVVSDGGRVSITTTGDQVVVVATGRVEGPGRLFGFLPAVTVRSEAVALLEGSP